MLIRLVPFAFVLLWSTGFIGARYGLPWIEPCHLLLRMLLSLAVFLGLILIFRTKWPNRYQAGHQMVVGLLVHAGYLWGLSGDQALPAGRGLSHPVSANHCSGG